MLRPLIAAAALVASAPAWAGGTVIWLELQVPDEAAQRRAEKDLEGGASHRAHADLAFPLQAVTPTDTKRYEGLRDILSQARERWSGYEVEADIAREIEAAIEGIDLVRDAADRRALVEARLLQGAAVQMALTEEQLRTGDKGRPYRLELGGQALNGPWAQARALDRGREVARTDLGDGSRFADFQHFDSSYASVAEASLDLAGLPADATLFIDGEAHSDAGREVFLRPGRHYLHLERDGRVFGRMRVDLEPARVGTLPLAVTPVALGEARAALLGGSTTFAEPVRAALDAIAGEAQGPVLLAAVQDGKVTVATYTRRDTPAEKKRLVTFTAVGELGGGAVVSSLFDGNEGSGALRTVPAASGSLGFELGISHVAVLGGADLALTPGHTVRWVNAAGTDNVTSSVLPQPWGGLGVYVLRPKGDGATLLLAGTYGWQAPAHLGFGGRIGLGVPIGNGNWFRMTVGGHSAPTSRWDDHYDATIPMHTLFFRVGLASRF